VLGIVPFVLGMVQFLLGMVPFVLGMVPFVTLANLKKSKDISSVLGRFSKNNLTSNCEVLKNIPYYILFHSIRAIK
jgi:hypothetical protein